MSFSQEAWKFSEKVIDAIKNHPFNQELMKGTLDTDKFAYYIEQDNIYLNYFAKCHAIIASRISRKYSIQFLKHAQNSIIAEEQVLHEFFIKEFKLQSTGLITMATLSYTSYLLSVCLTEPIKVAVAAVVPCFWVYSEVGLFIAKNSNESNKYSRWIETYTSEKFAESVNEIIATLDIMAENADENTRKSMLDAFYKSTYLELHFWNDAYNEAKFDDLPTEPQHSN